MPASVSAVSTAGVAPPDRLAFWERYNARALVGLTCSTYADDGLLARQRNVDLEGLRVADIAGNAHVIERTPRLVGSRPKDATFLSLLLEGKAFFYHSGGCLTLRAGDAVVYDTDRPYLFGFGTAMRQVLLDVPRAALGERFGLPALRGPVALTGDAPGAAALSVRALRARLLVLAADPARATPAAREEVLELAAAVVGGALGADPATRPAAAARYVAEHLGDPGLCADDVARAVGVSTRHLNRAFAAEGTTVARYIQQRRLERAREELAGAAPGRVRIADVAARCGFASQAHFARLFRARFGCAPSEVRDGGAAPSVVTGG